MSTTNGCADDPQAHGTSPGEPRSPDRVPAERPSTCNTFAWAAFGLSAVAGATGVLLCLTGHEQAGIELIRGAFLGGGMRLGK